MSSKKRGIKLKPYGKDRSEAMTLGDEVIPLVSNHESATADSATPVGPSASELASSIRAELEETLALLDEVITDARASRSNR